MRIVLEFLLRSRNHDLFSNFFLFIKIYLDSSGFIYKSDLIKLKSTKGETNEFRRIYFSSCCCRYLRVNRLHFMYGSGLPIEEKSKCRGRSMTDPPERQLPTPKAYSTVSAFGGLKTKNPESYLGVLC